MVFCCVDDDLQCFTVSVMTVTVFYCVRDDSFTVFSCVGDDSVMVFHCVGDDSYGVSLCR